MQIRLHPCHQERPGADGGLLSPAAFLLCAYFSRAMCLPDAGTSGAVSGKSIKIITPLLKLSKAQIAKLGAKLKVPFKLTWTCYKGGAKPCGKCDACLLRAQGFKEAGILDR